MKKILLTLVLSIISLTGFAQKEVTIKAGTPIPFQAINTVRARDVDEGENILFKVARDVNVDGKTAIPYGSTAKAKVTLAKKSSWWGTRGRLSGTITEIVLPDGTVVPIENASFEIKGKNRTTLSVLLFCFVTMPACLITGSKAELPSGYEITGYVARNVTAQID
jgi:hypothetical protein